MQTVSEVFAAFGGYGGLAAALKVPTGTASAWKTRDSIPAEYWGDVVAAASERSIAGVTLEALAKMAASKRRPPTDAPPARAAEAPAT